MAPEPVLPEVPVLLPTLLVPPLTTVQMVQVLVPEAVAHLDRLYMVQVEVAVGMVE
jgi:hypothetical protein